MNIYSERLNLFIGFHGCIETFRNMILMNPLDENIKISKNNYDWLGNGFYVWENNYYRALEWAQNKIKNPTEEKASVIGVVYSLGYCLDLSEKDCIETINLYYKIYENDMKNSSKLLPKNKTLPNSIKKDIILRELDCNVIEFMHQNIKNKNLKPYDSIRGIFTEGEPAFEGSGFQTKNHIQICIRNLNCIKGFFKPRIN